MLYRTFIYYFLQPYSGIVLPYLFTFIDETGQVILPKFTVSVLQKKESHKCWQMTVSKLFLSSITADPLTSSFFTSSWDPWAIFDALNKKKFVLISASWVAMRAARAFNWLIEWPCERVQQLHGSIIWIYRGCKNTWRHHHPQWIVCRVMIKYASFRALKMADRMVRVWAWVICIWRLIRAKTKLLRDGWFFPTAHNRMLNQRLYTNHRMSLDAVFSYFDNLTRSPP